MTNSTISLEHLLLPLLDGAYNTALRLTRSQADAEDLVQEAVLLACRGFSSFQPGSNFKAWFYRILTNCFFTKHREARRRGTPVELEDTPELYLYSRMAAAGLHTRSADPARWLMDRLDADQVAEALTRLPDAYRAVATLYFVEDMTYQDIAAALDLPVGTVRSRLHRARRMLQRTLWGLARERGVVVPTEAETIA